MYAIIATGGKQYRVSEGDVIYIEKIDAQVDSTVSFDVLLVEKDGDVTIGTPVVEGVKAEGGKLQEEGKKLMEQMRNPMLTAKAKADVEKELGDIQQKLIGIEQRYRSEAMRCRQDLQDLEGRLLKTTTDDLRKRLAVFAEKSGYDFIYDVNAVPYAKKGYDVTDEMLKTLGVDPKDAKGRDEGK